MTEPIVPGRLDRYAALALQIDCDGVHPDHDRESAARRMQASLMRIGQALEGARRWMGPELSSPRPHILVRNYSAGTGFPTRFPLPEE